MVNWGSRSTLVLRRPRADSREARYVPAANSSCRPGVPGLAEFILGPRPRAGPGARPGHERARSWRAKRTVRRSLILRCQTAQSSSFPRRIVAPGWVLVFASDPERGAGGAPTGALFLLSRGETRPIRTQRGAGRPMTRDARLSALHRGDLQPSPGCASISGIASGSVQRAPRSQVVMPGGRCPRATLCSVRSRPGTTTRTAANIVNRTTI